MVKTTTRRRALARLLVSLAVITTGLNALAPAIASADSTPPSVPANPHWSDETGVTSETISGNTTITASWNVSTDETGGSGIGQYHVQLAETPDFTVITTERDTGSTAASTTFTAGDGVAVGHSYYFRVLAVDVAGNRSTYSGPSNRVDISDQSTGPEIVHQPVLTASFGQSIPIDFYATCEGAGPCAGRLYWRTTGSSTIPTGAWQRVDLPRSATLTRINNTDAAEYKGTIPGWAVTTTGVDYYLEAEDTYALGYYPGSTFVDTTYVSGVQGTHTFAHIQTITPPLITHQPALFAQADHDIPLAMDAVCSTGNCTARLFWHTTTDGAVEEPLLNLPDWPNVVMQQSSAPVDLGTAGKRYSYAATIPASYVDTRGVDYFFLVTDGYTQAYWPGTTHMGYYAPTDGQRITWQHVHVLEPPHIEHAPVGASPYRANIPVTATSNCPSTRSCTAALYYRTTTSGVLDSTAVFTSTPMTVTKLSSADGNDVIKVDGTIPGSVADTRGVDYFFSISDGTTTSWYPGTSQVDGYEPVAGTYVGYEHVRVLEPPHIVPNYVPATPALQDLTIQADVTCATEHCDVSLDYTTSLVDQALPAIDTKWIARPMTDLGVVATTAAGRVNRYTTTIPAEQVTTRGLAYFIQAFDGYTNAFSPGTFYSGAYVVTDGSRIGCADVAASTTGAGTGSGPLYVGLDGTLSGCVNQLGAHIVRVLEPPHLVHVPITVADAGTEQHVTAASNCATPSCTATLHWRPTYGDWKSVVMTTTTTGVGVGGLSSANQYDAVIPASDVTMDGFQYWLEVNDGYVTDSTLTYAPVMRGQAGANYPPGVPDYPDPGDNALVYSPPATLSARYLDPEGQPGTLDIELYDATNNLVTSGTTGQITSNSRGSINVPTLANGVYRWRARAHDDLGATSPWTNYWTFALVNDDACSRFVGLWAPRVQDETYMDALRATNGYPADIIAEGFHSLDESTKRALIDCLYNYLVNVEPLPSDFLSTDIANLKDWLYKLIFDKANLPAPVNTAAAAVGSTVQSIPTEAQDTLNKIQNTVVPEIPAGLAEPLGGVVSTVKDLIPENLLQDGQFPATLALPEAQSIVDQAHNATSLVPALTSTANQVVDNTKLPIPIPAPFTEVVKTALQLTTYRACYESPTKTATCTDLVPLGTPVPVDVTGDGSLDVLMQLTPFADPNYPTGVTVKLSAQRLLTSEKPAGSLVANVWFIYDLATTSRRLRVGFDGWHRGTALAEKSELTYTIKQPLALINSDLYSHYSLTQTQPPANWALTVGWSKLAATGDELDPLVGSIQFGPPPGSIAGDLDITSEAIPGGDRRDINLSETSSAATKVDAILAMITNSTAPVSQDIARFVVDQLPTTASVQVQQDDTTSGRSTHIVTDANAAIGRVQATRLITPDTSKPNNFRILVGDFSNVPTHTDTTITQASSTMTVDYSAASTMTQGTVATIEAANGVLSKAALAQATDIPATFHLDAGADSNGGVNGHYTASSTMTKLLGLYYDASNAGTAVVAQAQSIPTNITLAASTANRQVSLNANGPIGLLDVKASRNGSPVLVLGGDHATVIANPNSDPSTSPLGVSLVIHGLQSASVLLNSKLEAHTKVVPGGQQFTALVYLDGKELGLMQVSNLPSTIDFTAMANSTTPTASYRASSRINDVVFFYTNLASGPTVAAEFTGVPASIDFTATLADPAKLDYTADSTLDQLVFFASTVSALKLNTANAPYLLGLVQQVPASIHASVDLDNGDYTWNASSAIPLVVVAARGVPPIPANVGVVMAATSVPASFEGHVSLANRSFSFQGNSGPIGRLFLAATNHGTVTVFPGNHVHAMIDQTNSTWDVSASLTNISSGSAVINTDLRTYKASLSANLNGQPLILDVNYIRNPGIQLAVQGIVLNFPSWLQVSMQDGHATFQSNANMTAALRAQVGWITALNGTAAPPWVLGVSVKDGSCTSQQGCGATSTELCRNSKCLAFKAALYMTGLPTAATLDWDNNKFTVSNYRPDPSMNWLSVYADIRSALPVPFVSYVEQDGIPVGVDITGDVKFVKRTDSRPGQYGFNLTATQPLGRLFGIGIALAAFNGADVVGYFSLDNTGTQFGLNASIGGNSTLSATTNTASPTNLLLILSTRYQGSPVLGIAELDQIPQTVDLAVTRQKGNGFQVPKVTYNASGSTLDGFFYVDGRLTADVASVDVEAQARVLAGFTNLGKNTVVNFDLANKQATIASTPATGQLWFDASFAADTSRLALSKDFDWSVFHVHLDGAIDLGPSSVNDAILLVNNLTSVRFQWTFPISFSITGTYGDMTLVLDKVSIRLDEAWANGYIRPNVKWLSSIKVPLPSFDLSNTTLSGVDLHLLRNVQAPLLTVSIGWLCGNLMAQPSPYMDGPAVHGTSGMRMYGSDGDQELWFDPGGLVPDIMGDALVAKFLSQLPNHSLKVTRC